MTYRCPRTLRHGLALLMLLIYASAASAQVPLEDLFRNSKYASVALSPNGKHLATTTNIDGRLQLAVVDLETNTAKNIAGYDKIDIWDIRWISNDRIVFNIINRDGEQRSSTAGLYAIQRDGTKDVTLMQSPELIRGFMDFMTWTSEPRWMEMLDVFRDQPHDIVAVGYFPNRDAVPYRVDSTTAKRKEIDYNLDGIARSFVFDQQNRLRVVVTSNTNRSVETVWYRDTVEAPWKKLSEQPTLTPRFHVLAFDQDERTMLVAAPDAKRGGRWSIHRFDFATNQPGEVLASDPAVDVHGGMVFAPDTRKLLGVRIASDPPRTLWLDKSLAALQVSVDKAFPGLVNVIHPGNAQAAMLIHSYSSTNPGQYALYYPDRKKLQNLLAARPWNNAGKLAVQHGYDYTARDGTPLFAYLTLPQGRATKALPMVVLVHGGPWGRDSWGFNPEVQFLAGMGYAVLQPQFRGSTGFGDDLFKKSFGQWGLAMQDDVTDGVRSLIQQGVVDAKRICIMGASYGGYAVMMGLVKDPELFRCGVNLFGVTNIPYLFSEGRWADDNIANYSFSQMVGDKDKLREQFVATSPLRQASRIQAPVFMVYGEKDTRVPLIHGEEMRDALKKAGKTVEYMELEKEEHGIAQESTRLRVYAAIEKFLKQHNPAQ